MFLEIDFFGMTPVNQFRWVQKNCYLNFWPLYPFMPVVNGTPVELETIKDLGYMHAKHAESPCITIYLGYLPLVLEALRAGYPEPECDYLKYNSAFEAVADGWRIDE